MFNERPDVKVNLEVPLLKNIEDKTKVDIRYVLISPYAFAHIHWDRTLNEIVYDVEEPILNQKEKDNLDKLKKGIKELVNVNILVEKNLSSLLDYIDKTSKLIITELGIKIDYEEYEKIFYYLYRDFIGFNEIDPLLKDSFIDKIECNGINVPLFVTHRIFGDIKTNIIFKEIDYIIEFVEKLAQRTGGYLSYSSPKLNGTLPNGLKINIEYSSELSQGPNFTIKRFSKPPITPIQLIKDHIFSPEMGAYFWLLLQFKRNMIITGRASSGKTELLNALSFFLPSKSKIVSIEESRKLNLWSENWIPKIVNTKIEEINETNKIKLLKEALKEDPDYIVLRDIKGKEGQFLFQEINSRHGSLSTMDGNNVEEVIRNLQSPLINLSPLFIKNIDEISVMTPVMINEQKTKRLANITEILDVNPNGIAEISTPFVWDPSRDIFFFKFNSEVFEKIRLKYKINKEEILGEFKIRTRLLHELEKRNITEPSVIKRIIEDYYENPSLIIKKFDITSE